MASCWERFDHIVCIHYAKDADRVPGIVAELERVGILPDMATSGSFRFHWTARGEFDEAMYTTMLAAGWKLSPKSGAFNSGLAHQQVIRAARDAGANRVLVLEDDIRFHRDADMARSIIAAWDEATVDICLFDKFPWRPTSRATEDGIFRRFDSGIMGGSCYALNRRGMDAALQAYDSLAKGNRKVLMGDEMFDYAPCRKAYAEVNACVQRDFPRQNNADAFAITAGQAYARLGVDTSAYAIEQ